MEYTSPLKRSTNANYAKHIFYRHVNDITIFIEDTEEGISKVFLTLLQPHLENIRLEKIFPLGGRCAVIEKAKKETNYKNIFIIDGDLYLLCGEYETLPNNTIRLEKYCIENYLIEDKNAIYDYIDSNVSSLDRSAITEALDIENWFRNQYIFEELYYLFAVAHKCKSGIKTTGRNHFDFLKSYNDSHPCKNKLQAIIDEIESNLIANNYFADNNQIKLSLKELKNKYSFDARKYVNGKLLLHLLFNLIKCNIGSKFKYEKRLAKIQLAKYCSHDVFQSIANQISSQQA